MEKKSLSKLEVNCNSIRENIKECGQLYILIAYKVYELHFYEIYKEKYKNIVECCFNEFGFKKATTYNLIGIVEKFGERDAGGMITYKSITRYNKFSYSQLAEMLSLSDSQREKVTPDTTVSEIRKIKKEKITNNEKVQTSGKINNSDTVETSNVIKNTIEKPVIEVKPEELKPVEITSSESNDEIADLKYKLQFLERRANNHWKARQEQAKTIRKLREEIESLNAEKKNSEVKSETTSSDEEDDLREEIKRLKAENRRIVQKIREVLDCKTFNIDAQIDIIKNNVHNNSKLTKRNAILTTDNEQLRIAVEQRDSEIKHLKKEYDNLLEEKVSLHDEYEKKLLLCLEQRDAFRNQILELKNRIEQLEKGSVENV